MIIIIIITTTIIMLLLLDLPTVVTGKIGSKCICFWSFVWLLLFFKLIIEIKLILKILHYYHAYNVVNYYVTIVFCVCSKDIF